MHWIVFAFMSIASWGLYVNVIHIGTKAMEDPINGRFKAFLFIGLAYFIIAVIGPIAVLLINNAKWEFSAVIFNPPKEGLSAFKWQFILGVILAATGGYLVSTFPPK